MAEEVAPGPAMRATTRQGQENLAFAAREVPKDAFGTPLVMISCSAAELIATRAYSNVTVGPVVVQRWVPDGTDEHLLDEIRRTQSLCETAVAEERQTIAALLRQSNEGTKSA